MEGSKEAKKSSLKIVQKLRLDEENLTRYLSLPCQIVWRVFTFRSLGGRKVGGLCD